MYFSTRKTKGNVKLRRQAGHILAKYRHNAGLSQRDLAAKLKFKHYTFVSQVEGGACRLPPDLYAAWSKAVGISAHELVTAVFPLYDPMTAKFLRDS
jgi:ribosome-binding protein aMBF1 (putative translation factor)